jgi:hypothetical protein
MVFYRQVSQLNFVCISHISHAFYMPHPSHISLVNHPNNIWSHKLLNFSLWLFLNHPVTSVHWDLNILLSTLLAVTVQSVQWPGYGLDDQGSTPDTLRCPSSHRIQTGSGAQPISCPMRTGVHSQGKCCQSVKLITPFNQIPRLRVRGAMPPLPHMYGMVLNLSTGTTLPLPCPDIKHPHSIIFPDGERQSFTSNNLITLKAKSNAL